MSLDKATIEKLAKHCEDAELNAHEITKITDDYPEMTYEDAYDIQWTARKAKEARGHKIVGMKMGLTSQAKMKQMGVPNPCYGYLADYFAYGDGAEIKIDELIHPKVEAEIAFILKDDLHGQFNSAVSFFYFHPDVTINKAQDNSYVCDLMGHIIEIQLQGDIEANLVNSFWHPEFGKSVPNKCLKINLLSNNYEILISRRSLGF